jgi:DNA polymerase-1
VSRLYLLDAGSIAAWKHFSVSDESAHGDLVEGVTTWWREFSDRYQPKHVVACFDCSRASNWRKIRYVEYKSARDTKPKDENLIAGVRALEKNLPGLGVPTIRVDGFEADDLIATLSTTHDDDVIIVTSDKDLMQLVDDRVQVYDPRPDKANECVFYNAAKVTEKHGVPPHRLRELLAIQGDSSDSIPGVPGWGKVAALTAIQQTKSRLELVRKAKAGKLDGITEKKQKIFADQIDAFDLAYELVGLRFDAPIPANFDTHLMEVRHEG